MAARGAGVMAARAVAARRPWQRLVPGASLLIPRFPSVPSVGVSELSDRAAKLIAFSPAAALWARPRRLQHEGQPEGQRERSDQVRLPRPAVPLLPRRKAPALAGKSVPWSLGSSGSSDPESIVGLQRRGRSSGAGS